MNLPTGLRGKLVALAILLILLILMVEFAIRPAIRIYQQLDEEILDMRQEILRMQQLISRTPLLEKAAAQLKNKNPLARVTLSGNNTALAAAELQQLIQDTAAKYNARIITLRVRPTTVAEENFERVMVEARLQAGITGLRNLLFALETNRPYLFIRQLKIGARPDATRDKSPALLDVTLQVYGMRNRDEHDTAQGA